MPEAETIKHSVLPFDKGVSAPQKQILRYLGLTIQAIWYKNAYDDSLSIRINDLSNLETLLITKLVSKSVFGAYDSNGLFKFALFVYDVSNINEPEVWLISQDNLDEMGRLDV